MDINAAINQVLVKLFRNINAMEEKALKTDEYKNLTTNDMHVIDAIGLVGERNMTSVARELGVTTGTLTIAINSLVKKDMVDRVRSEEDRRVVLISLTEKGQKAYRHHEKFHQEMVKAVVENCTEEEKEVLAKALSNLSNFFRTDL